MPFTPKVRTLLLCRFNYIVPQTFLADPPGSTMLPALDKHIMESRGAGTQSSLARGDVIEVQGPAASGKTQLLYHLAASCILPREVLVTSTDVHAERAVPLGGWGKSAIVFDCDGRWDITRLHEILLTRLDTSFSKTQLPPRPHKPNSTVSSIAFDSLSRLHIFRPTSSFQLAATLVNLPKYHTEKMPNEEIRLLFVDSISSFYWEDRWRAEHLGSQKARGSNALGHVLQCLQAFRWSHGPVIVLTNWGLNPLSSTASSAGSTLFFKQHLPTPFPAPFEDYQRPSSGRSNQLPLNCHLTLPFTLVAQFESDLRQRGIAGHEGMELQASLRDTRRKEVVHRGEIEGYVRIPRTGCGEKRNSIGRFRFQILKHDVVTLLPIEADHETYSKVKVIMLVLVPPFVQGYEPYPLV